ncbi:hypothetical protein PsorP6_016498 [Peronosclerospora sorghi]|uniref:Uncharacterized protein n=1 Tax=Peronosclerospora sorghi TaxID=230839 RepID=A0ACC0VPL4_9STRA|nr:hypothetical protein PsorP6_016498 [Peronosclerospora sorghi]
MTGYGKYEAVGSLSVGALLVLCGFGIGTEGLQALQEIWSGAEDATKLLDLHLPYLSGFVRGEKILCEKVAHLMIAIEMDRNMQWALAASAAGVSIAAKEALYRVTVKIGQQANSKVLIANAWHHRTDAISSVVALGGIMGSMAGIHLLDPSAHGGILTNTSLLHSYQIWCVREQLPVLRLVLKFASTGSCIRAFDPTNLEHIGSKSYLFLFMRSVRELTDNTVEAEVLETLQNVSRGVDDVLHVSQVRARRMGPYTLVDLRVHISKRVRAHILEEVPDVSEVLVHIDVHFDHFGCYQTEAGDSNKTDLRPYRGIKNDITYALATIPEITGTTHINTHWVPRRGTVVDVAILVQPDLKVDAAHAVAKKARKAIETIPYIVEADIHLELHDDDTDSLVTLTTDEIMRERSILVDFLLGSVATGGACIVSNPMEVVKTRMQLQGELAPNLARGAEPVLYYRNFIHAFYTIGRTEGLGGIQRGLGSGLAYQFFMNGPRLGLFEPLQKVFGATDPTAYSFPLRNASAAATSGAIGAFFGSPFFLVKARLQAASSVGNMNAQYAYRGMMDGFHQIVKSEGLLGLYRGATASIPRVAVGSATQLATYTQAKTLVLAAGCEDGLLVHLGSSILTGFVVTTAMNPLDVVSTRLYSQKVVNGKGKLYSGLLDCILKTMKTEGMRGFCKGWAAHYMRLGPHTIFTFLFWEEAKKLAAKFGY